MLELYEYKSMGVVIGWSGFTFNNVIKELKKDETILALTLIFNKLFSMKEPKNVPNFMKDAKMAMVTDKRILIRKISGEIIEDISYNDIDIQTLNDDFLYVTFIANDKQYTLYNKPDVWDATNPSKTIGLYNIVSNNIKKNKDEYELTYLKTCVSCKAKNQKESQFCAECGAKFDEDTIKIFCHGCNAENKFGDKFCGKCGAKLEE
jgi:rRNA maturation endonuclease Nob1